MGDAERPIDKENDVEESARERSDTGATQNERIQSVENDILFELDYIKDIVAKKYGVPSNWTSKINMSIPPLMYKQLKTIADYFEVCVNDLARFVLYKLIETYEPMLKQFEEETRMRRVDRKEYIYVEMGKRGGRKRLERMKIRLYTLPMDKFERDIISIAKKVLQRKMFAKIVEEDVSEKKS